MIQLFESSVLPASFPESHVRPEEQVSHRLADARLERREEARKRARSRTGGRRDV